LEPRPQPEELMRPAQHASYGSYATPQHARGLALSAMTQAQRAAAYRARKKGAAWAAPAPAATPPSQPQLPHLEQPPAPPSQAPTAGAPLASTLSAAVGLALLGGVPAAEITTILAWLLGDVGGEPAPAAGGPEQEPAPADDPSGGWPRAGARAGRRSQPGARLRGGDQEPHPCFARGHRRRPRNPHRRLVGSARVGQPQPPAKAPTGDPAGSGPSQPPLSAALATSKTQPAAALASSRRRALGKR
jgi:hypothetical protein